MFSLNKLPDISNYKHISNIPYLLLGILIVDILVLFLVRYMGIGGNSLNMWYDKLGLQAIIADVFIILIGFILGQIIYTHFIMPYYGWNAIIFILVVVLIQMIHDILLYYLVILPIPKGHNSIIDMYKVYAEENGFAIIPGDSMLMIGSAIVTFGLKYLPDYAITFITIFTIYTMIYILNTKKST
jgi:hypothetical protein